VVLYEVCVVEVCVVGREEEDAGEQELVVDAFALEIVSLSLQYMGW
jgi:hypothetical protein